MDDKMPTIIRSAIGSTSSIGFLKFLSESGFRVIGTDIAGSAVGRYFVEKFYTVPRADQKAKVVGRYMDIARKENASWIISGPEPEIMVLMDEKKRFEEIGASLLHPPAETLRIITDKLISCEFLKEKGVMIAATCALDNLWPSYPDGDYILKPRKGRGGSGVVACKGRELPLYERILGEKDYIVQEFIDGTEYSVDVLYDFEGGILNAIPRKRLKTDSGVSVVGETVRDEKLFELVSRISGELSFAGANCFQFMKNEEGAYFLLDINPRFGGGAILSLAASKGFRTNLVNILLGRRHLLSKSYDFEEAVMFRYYGEIFKKPNPLPEEAYAQCQ